MISPNAVVYHTHLPLLVKYGFNKKSISRQSQNKAVFKPYNRTILRSVNFLS